VSRRTQSNLSRAFAQNTLDLRAVAEVICAGKRKPVRAGDGFNVLCPAHEDRTPSLTIKIGNKGGLIYKCHAGCTQQAVGAALRVLGVLPGSSRAHGSPVVELEDFADAVAAHPWRGEAGDNERRLLAVAIQKARQQGSLEIDLSCRYAGNQLVLPWSTIRQAIKRAIRDGWLQPLGKGYRGANRYRLAVITQVLNRTQDREGGNPLPLVLGYELEAYNLVWNRHALGYTARRIYEWLVARPDGAAAREIRQGLRFQSTAYTETRLRFLVGHSLVEERDGRFSARTDVDWDGLAARLGVADLAKKIRAVHEAERRQYHAAGQRNRQRWSHRNNYVPRCQWLWNRSQRAEGTLVEAYLRSRGLPGPIPPDVHFLSLYNKPRMIVAICDVEGKLQGVQITTLRDSGHGREQTDDARRTIGSFLTGAVQLLQPRNGVLCIAEGVETALSVIAGGMHCWATLSAVNLKAVTLPTDVRTLIICADNDPAGLKYAEEAARRFRADGLDVHITAAPLSHRGADFNDIAMAVAELNLKRTADLETRDVEALDTCASCQRGLDAESFCWRCGEQARRAAS